MASKKEYPSRNSIPDVITDPTTKKSYKKGKFLGKGGFAFCYEFTDRSTMECYAGKVVSKTLLVKPHQKEKMAQEIEIHKQVHHKNIVDFCHYFEDNDNVYIILELCKRRSLMELHKRRKSVTEPEARYFMHQIMSKAFSKTCTKLSAEQNKYLQQALVYLHKNKVIHRDLKLGNLFLDDELVVKVGDFGLATILGHDGERKRTLCGTPNYIAPEVLQKTGHGYAVDVWSCGCIMYTLLCGRPPFETSSLKETYSRIKKNEYSIPSHLKLSPLARQMITEMLCQDQNHRPSAIALLTHSWFTGGYMPSRLPASCLTMEPRQDKLAEASNTRPPFVQIQQGETCRGFGSPTKRVHANAQPVAVSGEDSKEAHLQELLRLVSAVAGVVSAAEDNRHAEDDAEDPALIPIYWVAKWVDYSDKYGLGYQLCDDSIGVLYNDSTRLITLNNGDDNLQYIERDGRELFHSIGDHPETLAKKVVLLKYFRNYMTEHLVKTGAHIQPREGDEMARLPFLRTWFRTRSAIVLLMSNGTLQINFFSDHTKIIICPVMQAVTYIDEEKNFRTFKLDKLTETSSSALSCRLKYAKMMIDRILSMRSSSSSSRTMRASANSNPPMV